MNNIKKSNFNEETLCIKIPEGGFYYITKDDEGYKEEYKRNEEYFNNLESI